ncbi:MAG: hypothetical protein ABFD16_02205 [Thermoguttaceae bacterium]
MGWRGLALAVCVAAVLGCSKGGEVKQTPAALVQQTKAYLEDLAARGQLDSGMISLQGNLESLKATDPAKAEELLKDYNELNTLRDSSKIKAKAKAMAGKL